MLLQYKHFLNAHNVNVGFWALRQPNPRSGECVDVKVTDDQHQSWELTTCESLLPFMCRANACPAGELSFHFTHTIS